MTAAKTIQQRAYPDHRCPDEDKAGWATTYHGPNGGALVNITLIETACGCRVVGNGTLQHPVMIEPCDAHLADMYPNLAR